MHCSHLVQSHSECACNRCQSISSTSATYSLSFCRQYFYAHSNSRITVHYMALSGMQRSVSSQFHLKIQWPRYFKVLTRHKFPEQSLFSKARLCELDLHRAKKYVDLTLAPFSWLRNYHCHIWQVSWPVHHRHTLTVQSCLVFCPPSQQDCFIFTPGSFQAAQVQSTASEL